MSNLTVGELTGYVDLNTTGVVSGAAAGERATEAMSSRVLAAMRRIEAERATAHIDAEIGDAERELAVLEADLREMTIDAHEVDVEVEADKERRVEELEAKLAVLRARRTTVHVDVDVDESGFDRVAAASARARDELGRFTSSSGGGVVNVRSLGDEAERAGGKMSGLLMPLKAVAGAGAGLAALSSGVQVLGGLTAALGLTTGALGLVPAVAMSAATGIGGLKVATAGFGDALKNVGDPEKFAESLEKLSPAARGAATAVRDMVPAWKSMQQSVQERFFTGLGEKISALGEDYLPMMGRGFGLVADGANQSAAGVLNMLNETSRMDDIEGIIMSSSEAWRDMLSAIGPIVAAMIDIGAVGSPLLAGLTVGARGAAMAFQQFVARARESGQLREWIVGGLSALGDLAIVAGNVGEILGGIFRAANVSGEGFLHSLKTITQGIADMINSASGQETLRTLFETGATMSNLLMQALQAILPILPQLVQLLGDVAVIIGTALVGAIQVAAPILGTIVDFLSMFPGPVAAAVVALAGLVFAFKGVAAAVGVFNTVETIMTSTIGRAVISAVASALVYVAQWVIMAAAAMANAVIMAAAWVIALGPVGWLIAAVIVAVGLLVWAIVANWETIKGWLVALGGWFEELPGRIGAALTWLGQVIAAGATAAWTWLTTTLSNAISTVIGSLLALPGNVMYALGYLAGLVYSGALAAWRWLSETLPQIIAQVIAWLVTLPGRVSSFLSNLSSTVSAKASEAWTWLLTKVVELGSQALAWIAGLPGRVGSFLASLPGIVRNAASSAWEGFKSTTMSMAQSALAFVQSIPGRITGFFSGAGSWLLNAGSMIVNGLYNGIRNAAQGVLNYIADLGRQIAAGFAAAVGIHSPSKVFAAHGVNLGKGLMVGLKDIGPNVIASAATLGDQMSKAAGDAAAVQRAAAAATQSAVAAVREVAVDYGSISDAQWDRLLGMGYRGRAGDKREALYVPSDVLAAVKGGGNTDKSITVNVHNPLPETSSDSINRKARTLAALGS